jgi:hypothetical protein
MTMTDTPLPAAQTVDTVVHAFTQAELALADITSSIAEFRSASDQLAEAGRASEAATRALASASDASDRIATQVAGLASALGDAASALRAVDPDRLWAHLEAVEREGRANQIANGQLLRRTMIAAVIGAVTGAASVLVLLLALADAIAL